MKPIILTCDLDFLLEIEKAKIGAAVQRLQTDAQKYVGQDVKVERMSTLLKKTSLNHRRLIETVRFIVNQIREGRHLHPIYQLDTHKEVTRAATSLLWTAIIILMATRGKAFALLLQNRASASLVDFSSEGNCKVLLLDYITLRGQNAKEGPIGKKLVIDPSNSSNVGFKKTRKWINDELSNKRIEGVEEFCNKLRMMSGTIEDEWGIYMQTIINNWKVLRHYFSENEYLRRIIPECWKDVSSISETNSRHVKLLMLISLEFYEIDSSN